jgi:hypothetical protein
MTERFVKVLAYLARVGVTLVMLRGFARFAGYPGLRSALSDMWDLFLGTPQMEEDK